MKKLILAFLLIAMISIFDFSALFAEENENTPPPPTPAQVAGDIKSEVDLLVSMINNMQRENQSLQTQLDAEKQKTADLQTRMDTLGDQINTINEQLQTVRQENTALGHEIERLTDVDDENARLRAALEQVYRWLKGEEELIELLESILNE